MENPREGPLGVFQIREYRNPPYPFNIAPTSLQPEMMLRVNDYGKKYS